DDEVAGQRDLEAARQGVSLHRRDRGLGGRPLRDAREAAAPGQRVLATEEPLEVHAGREGSAGTGENERADIAPGVQLVDGGGDPARYGLVDGVARPRAVDRD